MHESTVIVVGGGASGLSGAAALSRRGVDAVVLEQDHELGGTWARRYERLHLHTVRRFSGLAHFPIPSRYPVYLSRDDVVAYLREYARHFGLRVVVGTTARKIRPTRHTSRREWTVEIADGTVWRARVVVIATGQYRQPIVPSWPGHEIYRGRLWINRLARAAVLSPKIASTFLRIAQFSPAILQLLTTRIVRSR